MGKALAAFLSTTEKEHVLSSLQFERLTPHTITRLSRFRKELEKIRERGYALDDEEATLGARCVGAPILLEGKVAAAISIAGPTTRIARERIPFYVRAVVAAAQAISRQLDTT
jgi:DNA-binding IclR family transcriptional regulator